MEFRKRMACFLYACRNAEIGVCIQKIKKGIEIYLRYIEPVLFLYKSPKQKSGKKKNINEKGKPINKQRSVALLNNFTLFFESFILGNNNL